MPIDTRTELERAYEILTTRRVDPDAAAAGAMSAKGRLHDVHENPFSEEDEPAQWASWVHGYFGLIDRSESRR